jgi:predicted house-cleaning noncanonical NTP pyrophosphatase (MazG superfamily)
MRVTYHKLVRDQIPAIIAADGGQPVTRVLDQAGYEAALRAKLLEEAHEAQAAPVGELVSELADVLEVLQALAAAHDVGWEDIVSEASRKRAERGGFDHRIFLEHVEAADPARPPGDATRSPPVPVTGSPGALPPRAARGRPMHARCHGTRRPGSAWLPRACD